MNSLDPQDPILPRSGVSLEAIARAVGTPVYVYSGDAIAARYRALDAAFRGCPHAIHYALKANSTLAVARLLRTLGSGADANSGGEIDLALRAGYIPSQILFTGVGKTRAELELAVSLGIKVINVESAGEIDRLDAIAGDQGNRARVAFRVNPDIEAETHPKISTGLRVTKFGIPIGEIRALARSAARRPGIEVVGLHVHVGSQILTLEPVRRAAKALVGLARELQDDGIRITHLDLGGGLGIGYDGAAEPDPQAYARAIVPEVADSGLEVLLEPGRTIVGPAGVLLATVVDLKEQAGGKLFVVIDAGMTELMRPALYGAFHRIVPVTRREAPDVVCDVVGPVCESSDTVGWDRTLPRPEVGDLLAICDTGAYGSVMASNYNRRPIPPEVLVEAGGWRIIRRRQTIDEMLSCEI